MFFEEKKTRTSSNKSSGQNLYVLKMKDKHGPK